MAKRAIKIRNQVKQKTKRISYRCMTEGDIALMIEVEVCALAGVLSG